MKLIIEQLFRRFEQKEVLKDIDFTFEEGRIYGLLGRNGAGKTTLFNCLNRDIKADSGSFYLEETAYAGRLRRRTSGMFSPPPLYRSFSPAGSFSSSFWTSIPTPSGIPGLWTRILRK